MKLPEDKNKRMQVLAAIGIGVLAVIVGIVFACRQVSGKKATLQAEIEKLEKVAKKAKAEIERMTPDHKENYQILTNIVYIAEHYIPGKRLGVYSLGANQAIETHVKNVGIAATPVCREIGGGTIHARPSDGELACYNYRVLIQASYEDFRNLVQDIEAANPYVSLVEITITGRAANPKADPDAIERHDIAFTVQWPIWRLDPDRPDEIRKALQAYDATKEGMN